jgi:hypothetical protein
MICRRRVKLPATDRLVEADSAVRNARVHHGLVINLLGPALCAAAVLNVCGARRQPLGAVASFQISAAAGPAGRKRGGLPSCPLRRSPHTSCVSRVNNEYS